MSEYVHAISMYNKSSCVATMSRCQSVLSEFLEGIRRSKMEVSYTAMANILIVHSQNANDLMQYTAIRWLREFVTLSGRTMLPHMAGMLSAILPCLAYSDEARSKSVLLFVVVVSLYCFSAVVCRYCCLLVWYAGIVAWFVDTIAGWCVFLLLCFVGVRCVLLLVIVIC